MAAKHIGDIVHCERCGQDYEMVLHDCGKHTWPIPIQMQPGQKADHSELFCFQCCTAEEAFFVQIHEAQRRAGILPS